MVESYEYVKSDSADMMSALDHSPASVAIFASSRAFQSYSSGIFSEEGCATDVNHGVAVVGYKANEYWIIRNSWGSSWGESGYMQMAMAEGKGICGINQFMSYPKTAKWQQ